MKSFKKEQKRNYLRKGKYTYTIFLFIWVSTLFSYAIFIICVIKTKQNKKSAENISFIIFKNNF